MTKSHGWRFIPGISLSVFFMSLSSWAANTTAAPKAPTASALNLAMTLPGAILNQPQLPDLSALNQAMMIVGQQMATMNACMGAQMSAGVLGQQCANPDSVEIPSEGGEALCQKFSGPGGFDQTLWQQEMMRVNTASTGAMCQKAQFGALQSQLNCVQQKQTLLMKQLGSLQDAFVKNIQKMQTDVQMLEDADQDRQTQEQDVESKLSGSAGSPGLMRIQEAMKKEVDEMPQQVAQAQVSLKEIQDDKKNLEQTILNQKMGLVSECFNQNSSTSMTTKTTFRCEPNGPPVSAREYVLCRYEQNQQLGKNGVIELDPLVIEQAKAGRRALENLLDTLFNDAPKGIEQNKNSVEAAVSDANRGVRIQSVEDFDRYYGDALAKYNGQGLDIRAFVLGSIKKCYSTANQVVEAKRSKPSSDIGTFIKTIQNKTTTVKTEMTKLIETYAQSYEEGIRALTGNSMPLSGVDICKSAAPEVALRCMEDAKKNIEGLLTGRVSQSRMNIFVKGTNVSTYIPIQCMGINGCVQVLSNVANNLKKEREKLKTFKNDYLLKAKQQVESFVRAMANQFSSQSAEIQNTLQGLSARLSSLGVPGLNLKPMESQGLELDEKGVPVVPKNVFGLIGGQMNPPMVELDGSAISESLQGVSEKSKELEKTMSQAQAYLQKLKNVPGECRRKSNSQLAEKIRQDLGRAIECSTSRRGCDAMKGSMDRIRENVNDLQDILSELGSSGMDDSVSESSLDAGAELCSEKEGAMFEVKIYEEDKKTKKDVWDKVNDLTSNCTKFENLPQGWACTGSSDLGTCCKNIRIEYLNAQKEYNEQIGSGSINGCGSIASTLEKDYSAAEKAKDAGNPESSSLAE